MQQLINRPEFMATPAAYAGLRAGPIDWLIDWISAPSPGHIRTVARAVPMMLLAQAEAAVLPDDMRLEDAARTVLLGGSAPASGTRQARIWRSGACALAVEAAGSLITAALVLDDRAGSLDAAHGGSWQEWLRLSNALALRDWPTVITTTGRGAAPAAAPPPEAVELPPEWAAVYAEAAVGTERDLVRALAEYGCLLPPKVGGEGPDGIPVDVSWPDDRLAARLPTMTAEDRADLEAAGWRVVEATPAAIAAALADAVPSEES